MSRHILRCGRALSSSALRASALPTLPHLRVEELLPSEEVSKLDADGAIVLRGVLNADWVQALREGAEANMESPGPLCDEHSSAQGTGGRFHDDQFLYLRHDVFRQLVFDSGLAAIAARGLRSSSAHVFYDQLLVKEPGTSAPTPWHNDTSYWHLKGDQICSTWVALDDVKKERGVQYVKGSHKWDLLHRITNFSGGDNSDKNTYRDREDLPEVPDIDKGVEEGKYELLGWDMSPGDVILFKSAAIHGASGNEGSTNRRRGYAVRWLGDDVVFEPRPATMNEGWIHAGYDNKLEPGSKIACELHPNILAS